MSYRPPTIKDNEMQRVINELYRIVNEIKGKIPDKTASVSLNQSGDEGKIKIEKTATNNYELSVKTNEGYVKTDMSFKE